MKIVAVLTAYHPDDRLVAVVDSALEDCAAVVVADNTPADSSSLASKLDDPRVTVLPIGRNLGLGGALNLAARELPADAEAVLLMDQDSVLPAGLVAGLARHLESDPAIGIAAPTPWDAEHGGAYSFGTEGKTVEDRPVVITSGMLVRRECVDRVPFRADLFNDFVDMTFCIDVHDAGFRIVQDYTLQLPHSMGDRREHGLGPWRVRVIHYPPWRHYWIARNGVQFVRDYLRRRPLAFGSMGIFLGRKFISVACWGPRRGAQVTALTRGVLDGLTGRYSLGYLPNGAFPPGVRDAESPGDAA
ncbi:glycosyltransferase [Actinospica robiniae]|uniref:glycosyltransferase n=1 Tax=Actinospica robiniae TaxID=304901 RepID=UPI0004107905|nr:glycosyltransferase [Actinospica robiniae]